jgi:hypothetical protein
LLSLRLALGEASAYVLYTLGAGRLVASLLVTWATSGRRGLEELWGALRNRGWKRDGTSWFSSCRWLSA